VKPVTFHSEASEEMQGAALYYEERQPGLGHALLDEIENARERIQTYPGIGAVHSSAGLRRYVLQRFPYAVFYLELPDVIWIAAVAHTSRRPGYWRHRRPEQNDTSPPPIV
jgi:toxin ParE1/3/4